MPHSIVSSCHSLKIIPISALTRFARIKSRVAMAISGEAEDALAIPGSIIVSQSTENATVKKKIAVECSDVSHSTADKLENYKAARLIATYIDETGAKRVSGSPDWPLSLNYSSSEGVFSVMLQGEDTTPDAFIMD